MHIEVVGAGAWGRALHHVLIENNQKATLATRSHHSPSVAILVLSVPTQSLRQVLEQERRFAEDPIIVNTAKGIEQGTHLLPHQIVQEYFPKNLHYFSLIGPSFASEINRHTPTLVNLGYTNDQHLDTVHTAFQTRSFRLQPTIAVQRLELASAFKNIYAIGCGLSETLGYPDRIKNKMIDQAVAELYRLFELLHFSTDHKDTPGVLGDLVMTCNSRESRNYRFGMHLAHENTIDALKKVQSTVEGFYSLDSVRYFEKITGENLRLASFIYDIVKISNNDQRHDQFRRFIKESF
jgi:glycerol-3-phosphate dehydrogenase (NAD(P)+)